MEAALTVSVGDLFVGPKEITFDSVEADLLYVAQLTIRNTGKTMTRLRISSPQTPYFTLSYVPTGSVAAGLSITADVEFQLPADQTISDDVLDAVTVTNGQDTIRIPLRAKLPAPAVVFDPVLDFGLAVLQTSKDAPLVLTNTGSRPAKWSLVFEDGVPIVAEPASGVLAPSSEALDKMGGLPAHLLDAANALLKEKQDELEAVINKVAGLQQTLADAKAKLEKLQSDAKVTENRLINAGKLQRGLADEQVRELAQKSDLAMQAR